MAQVTYEAPPHGSSRLEDSKRPYEQTPEGGITVRTNRRIGEVRVPNYVYDLWMPVLGMEAIALYSVYCRLEHKETCKGLSQNKLAGLLRIGTRRLADMNALLEECGFVEISYPSGIQRLLHYTMVITVLDPPKTISPEVIQKHGNGLKYGTLRDWLIDPDASIPALPNDNADALPNDNADALPNDNASICNPYSGNPTISSPSSLVVPPSSDRPVSLPKPPHLLKCSKPPTTKKRNPYTCKWEGWQEFLSTYPKRDGDRGINEAKQILDSLIANGEDPQAILDGVKNYRAYCDRTGRTNGENVKMMTTWLNKRVWEEYASPLAAPPSPNGTGHHPNGTTPTAPVDPEELYAAEIAVAARLFADPPG